MQDVFRRLAHAVADLAGTVWVFTAALGIIIVWAITGPIFAFSDTWQLIINTGTTIITFLMVFLIQNTQNRDNAAIHAKLDELIVHSEGSHNEIAIAENFTDDELRQLREHFRRVAERGGTNPEDRLPTSINGNHTGTSKAPPKRRSTPRKARSKTSR
jgi:low affinity Fe/Cu permease